MTKASAPLPTLADLRKHFEAFRDQCIWIRICHRNYEVLFEDSEETLKVLETVAVQFSRDLNDVMIDHLWLLSTRILDPAETGGRANLTVRYIDRALESHGLLGDAIKEASAKVMAFHEILKDPRNRVVAHLDLEAVMAETARGAHAMGDYDRFLRNLQVYLDLVGEALGNGPLDISPSGTDGDAITLVRVIRTIASRDPTESKAIEG